MRMQCFIRVKSQFQEKKSGSSDLKISISCITRNVIMLQHLNIQYFPLYYLKGDKKNILNCCSSFHMVMSCCAYFSPGLMIKYAKG